ncbi:winged helix-turn-helix transcriptional regulator [Pseudomonas sp. OTU750018]|uniref:winged helix-turn-helix transcriptional regulator n=1 Tax=Pseudomonas sp. OTU750018 TaxID=2709708 RepID=UPI00141F826D|nr:winged helix-turn-helix transcriptional regulator [Pseudomonas sp. OTU750018]
MKQKNYTLNLRDFTDSANPYGTARGRKAHAKLVEAIDALPAATVVGVSLAQIDGADVSFFRECLIYAAKRFDGQIALYAFDITDEDLVSNLQGAAVSGGHRLTCWVGNECRFVGPEPSSSSISLLQLVVNNRETTTSDAASALNISVQNASTRLKRLADEGFLLRSEESADSGGKEFVYKVIGKSA